MVVFQFANDIRAGKKVCYTLSRCPHRLAAKDATLSRWISRVRIPLGAPFKLRSPLPSRWRAFCYRYAGIRTRQGAELRKRASVFRRSTQGAERRSESGRRQPHADIPLGAPFKLRSPLPSRWRAFCYRYAGIRTRRHKSHCRPRARGQKMANMSTVTNLVTAISCHQKAIWTPGVLRRRNCRRLSAMYLDIRCVILHFLQKNNATGLVTVLIFDVFCPRPLIAWANQLQSGIQSVLRKQKPEPARCGPRLNTVTICQLRSTRRTGCRRRSGPASSRQPRSPPWHPRRHAAYP